MPRRMFGFTRILPLCLPLVSGGCGDTGENRTAAVGPLPIYVTIAPQAFFVKRVGGERVRVEVLVGPGQSHHSYEPSPRQVAGLAEARAYFRIGVPLERPLIEKIGASFRNLRIVDTTAGVLYRQGGDACAGHDHSHDDDAHATGNDPHIWLDPNLVKVQSRHIADALCEVDPVGADDYRRNLVAFEAELDSTNARVAEILLPFRGRDFFVFHPAFGYFGDAYGLKQVAVEEDGKEPTGKRLADLIDRARRAAVHTIFIQPQFPSSGAQAVAGAIGGNVVPLDPLAPDYLANLVEMARRIAAGFGPVNESATAIAAESTGR